MRRILLMLPVLALVACQAEAPTAADVSLAEMHKPDEAGLQIILLDWVVEAGEDSLEFFVINPTAAPQDCATAEVDVRVSHPNTTMVDVPDAAEDAGFCTDGGHWQDVTSGDGEPDLALHLGSGAVCDALEAIDGTHLHLAVVLYDVSGDSMGEAWETFRIRCLSE